MGTVPVGVREVQYKKQYACQEVHVMCVKNMRMKEKGEREGRG